MSTMDTAVIQREPSGGHNPTLVVLQQMNEVEDWFATKKPAAEAALRRVREIILGADERMTEYVKYGTVQFAFGGDMANFVQTNKKTVSLMFHRGGRIEGSFPHLEGTGRAVRFMRFADVAEVEARAEELVEIVRAWCAFAAGLAV